MSSSRLTSPPWTSRGWNVDLLRPARSRADIMQPLLALVQAIANYEVSTAVLDDHDWRINCDAQA